MPYPDLKDEIQTDPLGRGYADMTAQQVVDDMQAEYRTTREPIGSGKLVQIAAQRDLITTLETEAADDASSVQDKAKGALKMLERPDLDLDLADSDEEALVDALVEASVIDQTDKDALVSEAGTSISRAEELRQSGKRLPSSIVAQHIKTIRS